MIRHDDVEAAVLERERRPGDDLKGKAVVREALVADVDGADLAIVPDELSERRGDVTRAAADVQQPRPAQTRGAADEPRDLLGLQQPGGAIEDRVRTALENRGRSLHRLGGRDALHVRPVGAERRPHRLLVDTHRAPDDRIPGVVGLDPPARRAAETVAKLVVVEQTLDRGPEAGHVSGLDEDAGATVAHEVDETARGAGNNRLAVRHRLAADDAEALAA